MFRRVLLEVWLEVLRTTALRIQFQDLSDFIKGFRILVGAVIAGDDAFGLSPFHVGTPVANDRVNRTHRI